MTGHKTITRPEDQEQLSNAESSSSDSQYAYSTIEEFEEIVGYKVNDTFRDGWRMARTTKGMLGIGDKVHS